MPCLCQLIFEVCIQIPGCSIAMASNYLDQSSLDLDSIYTKCLIRS